MTISIVKMRFASFAALSGLFAVGPLVSAAEPAIEEVVVTAQKRTENVQDVPLAVSVVSGAELERISALGIADLSEVIPSVTFNTGRELRDSSIRIRGVGTDVFAAGIEPSVSTVIDGVVLAQQGSFFNDLGDLERVEVLRGPQGTLFGKNSSAGVIAFVTRNPNFEGARSELEHPRSRRQRVPGERRHFGTLVAVDSLPSGCVLSAKRWCGGGCRDRCDV